ncbi:MAG: DUF433 domain-containing protein [Planctomycetota bacterium]
MHATQTQYIEIRENRRGLPRPCVAGTRIRVQDIVLDYERHGCTADQIAVNLPPLSLAQVHSALAYYFDHKDEVLACIRDDEAYAKSQKAELTGDASADEP